jgi:hypothetical protein
MAQEKKARKTLQLSAEARRQRLAAALRSNLAKRKAQARGDAGAMEAAPASVARRDGQPQE